MVYVTVIIATEAEGGQEHDEVIFYQADVPPPEALWRLSEYKMHGSSATLYRLAVHLPGEQHVSAQEGQDVQPASQARRRDTHFEMNTGTQSRLRTLPSIMFDEGNRAANEHGGMQPTQAARRQC